MALLGGLGAAAIRFTALAKAILQTSRTQVTQFNYLRLDALTLDYQFGQRWNGHLSAPYLTVYNAVRCEVTCCRLRYCDSKALLRGTPYRVRGLDSAADEQARWLAGHASGNKASAR